VSSDRPGLEAVLVMLHVADLDRSAGWYADVLGFEVDPDLVAPDFRMLWSSTADESTWFQVGLVLISDRYPAVVGQSVGFTVDDVEAAHARAVAGGAQIVHPISDVEWSCREFSMRDPDGYVLYVRSLSA
jgi:catechol 2,3-dioxygenase-like lactoylglutathione lyase family enzyme